MLSMRKRDHWSDWETGVAASDNPVTRKARIQSNWLSTNDLKNSMLAQQYKHGGNYS
jgi:hypothetical protein